MVWEMEEKPLANSWDPKEKNPNYYLIYIFVYVCLEGKVVDITGPTSKIAPSL